MWNYLAFKKPLIFSVVLLLLLGSCNELSYDPSFTGDAPGAPGTKWQEIPIVLPEPKTDLPYSEEDLSATMTVADLLNIALFNNPSTRVSWNAARAAAFNYHSSLSLYYPTVGLTEILTGQKTVGGSSNVSSASGVGSSALNTGVTSQATGGAIAVTPGAVSTTTTNEIYTLFDQLTVTYLLLDFGGRHAQVQLAKQALFAADWQHNYAMQQVMLSVLTAYTSYIGNRELVLADEQDLKDAEMALKSAQVMQKAGLATLTDVLQSQSLLEQAKFNLVQARGAEKTSLANLLVAVGLPPNTNISVEDLPDQLPVINITGGIDFLLELSKRKRPDLGAAIAAVKEQQAQLTISYSAGMPSLSLNASMNKLHFFNNPTSDSRNKSIALQMNVPLFQGFYYLNQTRQIRAQIQEALANVDVQLSQIGQQVVTNYYALMTAVEALPNSEAVVELSARSFRGYVAQYKVGTSSILDMLNALTTLSNARAQEVVTRTQWAAALANLAFSVGVLGDTDERWLDTPPEQLYQLSISDQNTK